MLNSSVLVRYNLYFAPTMNFSVLLLTALFVDMSSSAIIRDVNLLDRAPLIVEKSETTKPVESNNGAIETTHLLTDRIDEEIDENVKTIVEQAQENIKNAKQQAKENIDRILQEARENLEALNSTAPPSTTRFFASNESHPDFVPVRVVDSTDTIPIDPLAQTANPLIQRVKENVERLAQEARENAQTAQQQVKDNLEVIRKETEGHDDNSK
ncbi:hypothetical protein M3Y98_01023200 [Aphelenchoides besseyi]|nr:hypothetical protein M3Y98_01023200 [Aphelenchoides besseyi]KAI6210048.1 hypothetical protein M3Y96_00286000 [Aphelenchoides besseyi]